MNIRLLLSISWAAFSLTCTAAHHEGKAPNVLIILADDVGFGDIPANYPEALVPMPHLDALAARGTRFTDAHSTSAVCAPTRYSVLSGNYPWRGSKAYGTWNFNGGSQFRAGQISLAQVLKDAGYHTAMFGKVHLGALVEPREPGARYNKNWGLDYKEADFTKPLKGGPKDLGFDYSFTTPSGIQDQPYAYFENDLMVGDQEELMEWEVGIYPNANGFSKIDKKHEGFGLPDWESNNYAIEMTNKAIAFLDRHVAQNEAAGEERPFFMHYCAEAVHVPHSPPKEYFGQPVLEQTPSHHLDMLLELDLIVGKLVAALEERGELENTIIIFASDNGGLGFSDHLGHDASGGFRGNKVSIYEGGHRIPMIMRWDHGGIPAGAVYPHLSGIQDLYATLAELTGAVVPEGQALDSISFKDRLMGEETAPHRVNQLAMTIERTGHLAFRRNEWKLIMDKNGSEMNFFNLKKDPFETKDLVSDPELAPVRAQVRADFEALDAKGIVHP